MSIKSTQIIFERAKARKEGQIQNKSNNSQQILGKAEKMTGKTYIRYPRQRLRCKRQMVRNKSTKTQI